MAAPGLLLTGFLVVVGLTGSVLAFRSELERVISPQLYAGNTVTSWLYTLHEANIFGLPYRIFVCVLGLAITILSGTGVYI